MELLFVVWVEKPKGALADGVVCFGNQAFEVLDGHTRASDAHKFVDVIGISSA